MSLQVKVARSQTRGIGPGVGDPGLFGSILSGITGIVSKVPGPIGWAAGAVSRLTASRRSQAPMQRPPSPLPLSLQRFGPPMPQEPASGVVAQLQRWVPGGESGMVDAPPIGAPSGYHVNKTAYFLKDGTFIPEGSRWVKNRHRNPLNPRAASKAIGRIESLKRATARFSRITIRKPCCSHSRRKTSSKK